MLFVSQERTVFEIRLRGAAIQVVVKYFMFRARIHMMGFMKDVGKCRYGLRTADIALA